MIDVSEETVLTEMKRAVKTLRRKKKTHVDLDTDLRKRFEEIEINRLLDIIGGRFDVAIQYSDRAKLVNVRDLVSYIQQQKFQKRR